jgi:hypothetical protein
LETPLNFIGTFGTHQYEFLTKTLSKLPSKLMNDENLIDGCKNIFGTLKPLYYPPSLISSDHFEKLTNVIASRGSKTHHNQIKKIPNSYNNFSPHFPPNTQKKGKFSIQFT